MANKDNPTVAAASQEAQKLLSTTFERLKENASVKVAEGGTPVFFPYGIELIFVKVEAGLTEKTKVSVEVRIAGERAPKESVAATESGTLEAAPTVK